MVATPDAKVTNAYLPGQLANGLGIDDDIVFWHSDIPVGTVRRITAAAAVAAAAARAAPGASVA